MGIASSGNGNGNGSHYPVEEVAGCGGQVRRTDSGIQRGAPRSSRLSRHACNLLENSTKRLGQQVRQGLREMGRQMECSEESGILEAMEEVERLVSRHLERVDHDDVR